MAFWTIEEVADHLGMTVTQVRESRRKGEWPGTVGKLQGRRLRFRSELIEAGPQEPKTTNDPVEAILWTAQGIEAKLAEILTELRRSIRITPTDGDTYRLIVRDGDVEVATDLDTGESQ